jgi:hypothetical protein
VDDALAVHIVDGLEDLLDQIGRVLFRVAALLDDPVEQFAAAYPAAARAGDSVFRSDRLVGAGRPAGRSVSEMGWAEG